jgi:hypothetical protein
MKRRDFILRSVAVAVFGLVQNAYALTWAAPGKMGYKEVSPNPAKKCSSCGWYTADAKTPNAGTCKFPGIKNVNGGGEVHVKGDGFCGMWKKKG